MRSPAARPAFVVVCIAGLPLEGACSGVAREHKQPGELVAAATSAPIVTSRGPHLEASDPTAVRLDSGRLQLVEFFRFT